MDAKQTKRGQQIAIIETKRIYTYKPNTIVLKFWRKKHLLNHRNSLLTTSVFLAE